MAGLNIRHEASPNFNDRPTECIDTIVLHATVIDDINSVINHFKNPASQVSAHYTIDKDGSIVQHVDITKRAWHAGKSQMADGRENVNDFSIGIELINPNDGIDPWPDQQIAAIKELIQHIKQNTEINYIVSHAEIAVPAGRKSDPLGLNISQFISP